MEAAKMKKVEDEGYKIKVKAQVPFENMLISKHIPDS